MSSKLLHAIVGAGIALGAGGACMSSPDGIDPSPDAFCDTTWPVTKGGGEEEEHYFPACLDPTGECRAYESEVACIRSLGMYSCEGAIIAATCVDAAWACPEGWKRVDECPCFGTAPPGYECTAKGLVKIGSGDPGAGGSASTGGSAGIGGGANAGGSPNDSGGGGEASFAGAGG